MTVEVVRLHRVGTELINSLALLLTVKFHLSLMLRYQLGYGWL